jgi:Na+/phosphate symporter
MKDKIILFSDELQKINKLKSIEKRIKQYKKIYQNYNKKIKNLRKDENKIINYINNLSAKITNDDLDIFTKSTYQELILDISLNIDKINNLIKNYEDEIKEIIPKLEILEIQLLYEKPSLPKFGLKSMYL